MVCNRSFLRAALAGAFLFACSGQTSRSQSPTVAVSSADTVVRNDGSKLTVKATALDATGKPGTGSITFTSLFGDLNGTGLPSYTAPLAADGTATATYACSATADAHCVAGNILVGALWNGTAASVQLQIVGSAAPLPDAGSGGTGSTGGSDAGTAGNADAGVVAVPTALALTSLTPGYVYVSSAAAGGTLPGTANALLTVSDQNGNPFAGTTVALAELPGESLVTLGSATATTNAAGQAQFAITGGTRIGLAHLTATMGTRQVSFTVQVYGGPVGIAMTQLQPAFLGVQGSGVLESGHMSFAITDAAGDVLPGVTVNFTQGTPALVQFASTSAVTDATGTATAAFTSGTVVGVSSIKATIANTSYATSQSIAVRGAKPSASGLSFRCSRANLGAYDTTAGYDFTTCTVRLSDRYGNRVGVPTAVSFATEAGSISATATTQAFSYANPTDPNEGSVTVTFSTDMGNGFKPVDVAPLLAAPAQIPQARTAEPSVAGNAGTYTYNPRDQLVTLIAMVRGEESFVDANLNGVYDAGELFVDQGDPFVDANDNNAYDSTEQRFCGQSDCQLGTASTTYNAGNGKWDSDKVIWAPTWVVFSGFGAYVQPTNLGCLDYKDNSNGNPNSATTAFYALDPWLNTPVAGTTFTLTSATSPSASVGTTQVGLFAEADQWGAMGVLGYDFDYVRVGASCAGSVCTPDPTKTCSAANGCMEALLFYGFDSGQRGAITVTDSTALPAKLNGAGWACGAGAAAGTAVSPFNFSVQESGNVGSATFVAHAYGQGTAAY